MNGPCHGHSHGSGANRLSDVTHPNNNNADNYSEEVGEFDGDFTRAACCIREEEENKKRQVLMKKLKEHDPVQKALDVRFNAKSWKDLQMKTGSTTGGLETQESDDDFEDEEILKMLVQERLSLNSPSQSVNTKNMMQCNSEKEIMEILSNCTIVICLLTVDNLLSSSLKEKLTHLAETNFKDYMFVCCSLKELQGTSHRTVARAFKAKGDFFDEGPLMIALGKGPEVLDTLSSRELDCAASIEAWVSSLIPFRAAKASENETSESEEEDGFICEKEGCDRKFYHEHVKRLYKAEEFD